MLEELLEAEMETERCMDLLAEAADFYAETGRIPNTPKAKKDWSEGTRLSDPPGTW